MPSPQQRSTTPENERDRFRTPPWLYRFLESRFGPFDVDLAADNDNALCRHWITAEEDATTKHWPFYGRSGFCNPPFSYPKPFVLGAVTASHDGFSTTLVLPTHRNQAWAALAEHATERIEFEGRVDYLRPDGSLARGNLGGTQILYFRAYDLGNTRTVWCKTKALKARWGSTRRGR